MQLFRFVAVIHNKAAMVSDHYIRAFRRCSAQNGRVRINKPTIQKR